jgi:hypothetical protein
MTMATQNAVEFLKQLVADATLGDALAEGYKNLLCQLGGERGFAFSVDELAEAAEQVRQAAYTTLPASGMQAQTHLRAGKNFSAVEYGADLSDQAIFNSTVSPVPVVRTHLRAGAIIPGGPNVFMD